jgi:hypothetical protein
MMISLKLRNERYKSSRDQDLKGEKIVIAMVERKVIERKYSDLRPKEIGYVHLDLVTQ